MTQQFRTAKQGMVREKPLQATKAKTAGMKLEMKCQTEMEDVRASFENEKRKLDGFA
jgi:hypothetical protein